MYDKTQCLRVYPNDWQQEATDEMQEGDKFGTWLKEEFACGADTGGEQYMISKMYYIYTHIHDEFGVAVATVQRTVYGSKSLNN